MDDSSQNSSIPEETVTLSPDSSGEKTSKPKSRNLQLPQTKVIATIFGIMLLIAATLTGVLVVTNLNNKQLISQKAAGTCTGTITCNITYNDGTSNTATTSCGNFSSDSTTCNTAVTSQETSLRASSSNIKTVSCTGPCFYVVTPPTSCSSGYYCTTGAGLCPDHFNDPGNGSCTSNGSNGICCLPQACNAPYCLSGTNLETCIGPMHAIYNPSACGGGYQCICGTSGGSVCNNNGTCDSGETNTNCPADCSASGGSGSCQTSTWCTTQANCDSLPGSTSGSGAGFCSNSTDVRCCPPGGYQPPPASNTSQGVIAFCQDGTQPTLPLAGINVELHDTAGVTNFYNQNTDATGKTFFQDFQASGDFDSYIFNSTFTEWTPSTGWTQVAHPLATDPRYANLKLSNGQPYSALTVGDKKASTYYNCQNGGWFNYCSFPACGRFSNWFCTGNYTQVQGTYPPTNGYALSSKYFFDIPTYSMGKYGIIFQFSNCTPAKAACNGVCTADTDCGNGNICSKPTSTQTAVCGTTGNLVATYSQLFKTTTGATYYPATTSLIIDSQSPDGSFVGHSTAVLPGNFYGTVSGNAVTMHWGTGSFYATGTIDASGNWSGTWARAGSVTGTWNMTPAGNCPGIVCGTEHNMLGTYSDKVTLSTGQIGTATVSITSKTATTFSGSANTGTYTVTGTIAGTAITMHLAQVGGTTTANYTGTIGSNGVWTGTVTNSLGQSGTFVMTPTSCVQTSAPPVPTTGVCRNVNCSTSSTCACASPTPVPTPSPSPAPTPAPQCTNVKAYDANWNLLTNIQLVQLTPGATVNFTVTGTTGGTFDAARFTINGALEPNTTLLKPGTTNEFYMQYTIPVGVPSFVVTAQLHDTASNSWY
jgi:hypothetical protein